jgi:hypothetical protein
LAGKTEAIQHAIRAVSTALHMVTSNLKEQFVDVQWNEKKGGGMHLVCLLSFSRETAEIVAKEPRKEDNRLL